MVKILFFARVREQLNTDELQVSLNGISNVAELVSFLIAENGSLWADVLQAPQGVLVAVNQEMCSMDMSIDEGDEVAFFPPVTGG